MKTLQLCTDTNQTELDTWINSYKVRAFPWIDGKRIYFNVQYYQTGQSIEKPPVWDNTIYITNDKKGRNLVFNLTHSLVGHVARMIIKDNTEITLTVE